jgi:hypothetical protein
LKNKDGDLGGEVLVGALVTSAGARERVGEAAPALGLGDDAAALKRLGDAASAEAFERLGEVDMRVAMSSILRCGDALNVSTAALAGDARP